MATEKDKKPSNRGGARVGAGRPKGRKKVKISVSVSREIWNTALSRWKNKGSRLVDMLLDRWVKNEIPQ